MLRSVGTKKIDRYIDRYLFIQYDGSRTNRIYAMYRVKKFYGIIR